MKAEKIKAILRQVFDSDRFAEVTSTLAGNKSRTMLTAFGIFWGVFMFVLLLGGGKGLQELMMSNFGGFATNAGVISEQNTTKAYKGYSKGRDWNLSVDDVEGLRNYVSGLDIVIPISSRWGKVARYSNHSYSNDVLKGIVPEQQYVEIPKIKYGRFINANDLHQVRKVCVIGKRVYESLFPDGGNPCGKFINVDNVYYEVVGVDMHESNIGLCGMSQDGILVPYTVFRNVYNCGKEVSLIAFTAKRGVTIASIEDRVRAYISHTHNIHPDDRAALEFFNLETFFQMFDNLFNGINLLVWLIGVGTVLSGVIGVTNIMLVSIRERTVELGIRRAIGAKPRDLLVQILSESEIMTILAGMSGILAAVGILAAIEPVIRNSAETSATFQIPFGIAISVVAALVVMGLIAGIFPAARALAIKPVDAMKDE